MFVGGLGLALYGFLTTAPCFCPLPAGVPPCECGNSFANLEFVAGIILIIVGTLMVFLSPSNPGQPELREEDAKAVTNMNLVGVTELCVNQVP